MSSVTTDPVLPPPILQEVSEGLYAYIEARVVAGVSVRPLR